MGTKTKPVTLGPLGLMPLESAVILVATAIAKFETGVRTPGPFPLDPRLWKGFAARNNNPGNLRFARQRNAVPGEGGYAKFPTPQAGWQALLNEVRGDISKAQGPDAALTGPTATLADFISAYADRKSVV